MALTTVLIFIGLMQLWHFVTSKPIDIDVQYASHLRIEGRQIAQSKTSIDTSSLIASEASTNIYSAIDASISGVSISGSSNMSGVSSTEGSSINSQAPSDIARSFTSDKIDLITVLVTSTFYINVVDNGSTTSSAIVTEFATVIQTANTTIYAPEDLSSDRPRSGISPSLTQSSLSKQAAASIVSHSTVLPVLPLPPANTVEYPVITTMPPNFRTEQITYPVPIKTFNSQDKDDDGKPVLFPIVPCPPGLCNPDPSIIIGIKLVNLPPRIKVDWKIPGLPFKIRIPECFNFLFIDTCPPETPDEPKKNGNGEDPPKSIEPAPITGNSFPSPSTSAAVSSSVARSSAPACQYKGPINWDGDTVFFSMDPPPATSSYGSATSPPASPSDPGSTLESSSSSTTTSGSPEATSSTISSTTTPVVTNEAPKPLPTVNPAPQPPPAATSPASPPSAPPSRDSYCRISTIKKSSSGIPEWDNNIEIYGLGFGNTANQAQAFKNIIDKNCYKPSRWVFKVGGEAKGKVWDWTVLGTFRGPQGLNPDQGWDSTPCLTKSLMEFGAGPNAGCDHV